jgi:HK97 family phage portal protein
MGILDNFKKGFSRLNESFWRRINRKPRSSERYVNVATGAGNRQLKKTTVPDLSQQEMVDGYMSAVYSATKRIADAIALTSFKLYQTKNNKMEKVIDFSNPFYRLFMNPNPLMDHIEVMERVSIDLDLTGNAYLYVVRDDNGIPVELHPLLSQNMTVVPEKEDDEDGHLVAGYLYSLDSPDSSYPTFLDDGRTTAFSREEIIHFKTANPKSLFYGFSPIEAARYSIDTDTEMSIQRLRLLQNRAIPEGLLVSQRPLTQEDAERIRTQWNQLYQGRNQRGKLAVLDAGSFNFQRLGLSAEELEFQEGKESVWQEIFAVYRVPYAILGGPEVNKATVEAAERIFIKDAIKPRLAKIQATMNKFLMPMFGDNVLMLFDDPTSKDSSFRLLEKKTNLQMGMTTINEERERDGLEPVEWGDVPLIQMNMTPLGQNPKIEEVIDVRENDDKEDDLDKWLNEVFEDREASEDLKA